MAKPNRPDFPIYNKWLSQSYWRSLDFTTTRTTKSETKSGGAHSARVMLAQSKTPRARFEP